MSELAAVAGTFYLFAVVFLLYLAIVWVFLPFAIFGTKPLLRKLIAETQRTNELLAKLAGQPAEAAPPNVPTKGGPADAPGWMKT